MSWEMGVTYGEALAKGLWEYFKLSDYFKIWIRNRRGQNRKFDQVQNYWGSVIEPAYQNRKTIKQKSMQEDSVVKLENFSFVEWFPWLPGRYWTKWGEMLRHMAPRFIERDPRVERALGTQVLTPRGKGITIMSGIGSLRMRTHAANSSKFKIIGATTTKDASSAIPIVMSERAFGKLKKTIQTKGSAKATIQGIYKELPISFDSFLNISAGIPRSCLYVGSPLNVSKVEEGEEIKAAGWSIYSSKRPEKVSMSFCYFNVKDENGPANAGEFLRKYIDRYGSDPITDFDEMTPRLDATVPLTQVRKEKLDFFQLQSILKDVMNLTRRRI